MSRGSRWLLILFVFLLGAFVAGACSTSDQAPAIESADASSPGEPSDALVVAARLAAGQPGLAQRLLPSSTAPGFVPEGEAFASSGLVKSRKGMAWGVGGVAPARADRPLVLGIGNSEQYSITLTPRGAASVPATLDAGRLVYASAWAGTDLLVVGDDERVEWLYLVHDTRAVPELRMGLELGSHLVSTRRDRQGSLELLDAESHVIAHVTSPVAIDARGKRRSFPMEYRDGELAIRTDFEGLTAPVLIDPAVETVAWEQRTAFPEGRERHMATYNSDDGTLIIFGGLGTDYLADTWEFDSNHQWHLRATTGPIPRVQGGMAYNPDESFTLLFGGIDVDDNYLNDTWTWDGNSWTQICTGACTRPAARAGHQLAFQPGSPGTMVTMGGYGNSGVLGDTWYWTNGSWVNQGNIGPSARSDYGMTYDANHNYVVLQGGINSLGAELGDTWTWSFGAWTLRSNSGPYGYGSALGYLDLDSQHVYLYGGRSGGVAQNRFYEWSGSSWSDDGAMEPGAVEYATMVGDGNSLLLFGGLNGTGVRSGVIWGFAALSFSFYPEDSRPAPRRFSPLSYAANRSRSALFSGDLGSTVKDVWEWNGFSWVQGCPPWGCSPSPNARWGHGFTYASSGSVGSTLFGGYDGSSYYSDTWVWDGTAWSAKCAACVAGTSKPAARRAHAQVYDSTRNVTIVFGGTAAAYTTDQWAFNGTTWTKQCAACVAGTTMPSQRQGASMAFDSARGVAVLYGGYTGSGYSNEVWEWDGTNWTKKCTTAPCTSSRPSGRRDATFTYDPIRGRSVLYGGDAGGMYSDAWDWDGSTWTLLSQSAPTPPPRAGHSAAYDTVRRRIVTFGGADFGALVPDVWEYHGRGGACASAATCPTGYCVDGVCCESPSCGTCQACNLASSPGVCSTVKLGVDTDTCSGTQACDANGACKKAQGQLCGASSECASGSCSDGVCCNTSCAGGCDVCSSALGAAANGTCTVLASGASGSCAGFLCKGAADCPSTCATDNDCSSTYFCSSDGSCQPRRAQGNSCNSAVGQDCKVAGCRVCSGSNTCVDFVCCNSACSGTCQTCAGATPGTCTTVTGAIDVGTCAAPNVCDATGTCKKDLGQACAAASECASGACVAGTGGSVCCSSACNGGCEVCRAADGASADGSCSKLPAGTAATCGNYLCAGGSSCPTTCSADSSCVASAWCSGTSCVADQANGGACTSGSQCASGNCVDGFCCNSTCAGACQACSAAKKGSGSNGTCGNVAVATDPDNECPTDATSSCDRDGTCDGAGACRNYAAGTVCGAGSCSAGTQTAYACDGSGTCVASNGGCSPYTCNGSTGCFTSCANDTQCASTFYCSGSACVAKKAAGVACTAGNECTSTFCADGVCCGTACTGACQACTAAKKGSGGNGTCGNIAVGTDPDAECALDSTASCQHDGMCDGAGACRFYASGTSCAATTCSNATLQASSCNGTGTCVTSSTACATGYACTGAACATTCATDGDCAGGYYCRTSDGTCQAKSANGAACTLAAACQSGFCADGVCCDVACAGACQACTAAKKGSGSSGTCGAIKVDTDPDAECAAQAATTCGRTGNCDGVGACKLFTSGTSCGTTACLNALQTGQICDGSGACVTGTSTPCATGYVCASSTACATSCTTDAQCAASHYCRTSDGTCQPDQASGATCSAASQCQTGNCVDGVCCDAPCAGSCQACTAAKKGGGADGACGSIAINSDPDSECAADLPSTCGLDGACDGAGACRKYAPGVSCGSSTCSAGVQTGYQCDGFGQCQAGQSIQCAPYVCSGAGACRTTCAADADCVASAYCDTATSTCKTDKTLGGACTAAAQCQSGVCADGVCCDRACSGTCEACTAALKGSGATGTCGAVAGGSDPKNQCPTDPVAGCARNGTCNGQGGCALYAAGTACGATSCTAGQQSGLACNGFGTCQSSGAVSCAPYACGATTCATACADDGDCVPSHFCRTTDGTCQPDQAVGAACAASTQCLSGSCADGVCCESPCSGTCQACAAAKTGQADGLCRSITSATDPDDECPDDGAASCQRNGVCSGLGTCALYASGSACGATTCTGGTQTGYTCNGLGTCQTGQSAQCAPYVCNGTSSCFSTCGTDSDCIAAAFCSGAACTPDQPNGGACTSASQCQSGNCVDGVCCDQACTGSCKACSAAKKGGGADGVCDVVAVATDPDNDCAAEAPETCGGDGSCDGAGNCRRWAPGTACGQNVCAGSTLSGSQCDGFGACVTGQTVACDPYVCIGGTSCATTCASDADCIGSAFCQGTTCAPRQDNGATCAAPSQCKSGFCVEGLCCDSACDGTCQACAAANKASGPDGVCGHAGDGTDAHGDCDDETASSCGRDGQCDGQGACRNYAVGTVCGQTDCDGNVQTGFACAGPHVCQAGSRVSCALYGCVLGVCLTECQSDAECSSEAFCDVTTSTCTSKSQAGQACTDGSTCISGFCTDGVCCDSACDGQCQACDLPTAPGKCSPVVGAPRGARPACAGPTDATPEGLCQARACDGTVSTTECTGYVGASVSCRDRSCNAGTEQYSATCDGQGHCGAASAPASRNCSPYLCATDACSETCAADAECAAGFRCDTTTGECAPGSTCDGDHTITNAVGDVTDCAPFRCSPDGLCIDRCETSEDCVIPTACNSDHVCVRPTSGAPAEDSGCGCRAAGAARGRGATWLALLAAGALALRRVRRRAVAVAGAAVASLALLGCSSDEPGAAGRPDAGAPSREADVVAEQIAHRASALARPDVDLVRRLAPRSDGLQPVAGGWTSSAWRGSPGLPSLSVGLRLGSTADSLFSAGIGSSELYRLDLHAVDAVAVRGRAHDGRVIFPGAYRATDLIFVADGERVEWAYLLADESAPSTFRYDAVLGAHLSGARVGPQGDLVLEDEAGNALLRVTRPMALDSDGTRRAGEIAWHDGELVISFDPAGLRFPVLLDPIVEAAQWDLRTSPPTSRRHAAFAYDATRSQTVLFGGIGSSALGDTWTWNGTTWTLRSVTGPSARYEAKMVGTPSGVILYGGTTGTTVLGDTWSWNGSVWTQLAPALSPSARTGGSMAYDAARGAVVLFGGHNGAAYYSDVYEFSGGNWALKAASGPVGRIYASLACSNAGSCLVFGGQNSAGTSLSDTWTWNGSAWSSIAAIGLTARYGHVGIYTSGSTNQFVVFGGIVGGVPDSGVYSISGSTWSLLSSATPGGNYLHAGAWDSSRLRMVTFGGLAGTGYTTGQTWEWQSPATWSEPGDHPSPRTAPAMGFDTNRGRIVLFGGGPATNPTNDVWEWNGFGWTRGCTGCSSPSARTEAAASTGLTGSVAVFGGRNGASYLNDYWTWNGTSWTVSGVAGAPSVRSRSAMAYDSYVGRMHVFGGSNGAALGGHYAFTGGAWSTLCGACLSGITVPTARMGHAMAAIGGNVYLFGGTNGSTYYNDLWRYTQGNTTWTQLCTSAPCSTTKPAARADMRFAYDSVRNALVLYGGSNSGGTLNDTWLWSDSAAAWTQTSLGSESDSPAPRDQYAGAYDATRRRMIVFGGRSSSVALGDTWELHLRGDTCYNDFSCASGHCVDGVCCESPVCGTCEACNLSGSMGVCAPVTNATDDTCSGTSICNASGLCGLITGQACSSPDQCASGYCSDGYCCNSACAGGCDSCSVARGATVNGTCKILSNGTTSPVGCGSYLCGGGAACPTACTTDANCISTSYCASDGTCQPRRAQGQPCNTAAGGDCKVVGCLECTGSNQCVDGVCCSSACTGTCQTCNGATPGTCTAVTSGTDVGTCSSPNTCTATGTCKKQNGQTCALANECASGFCADGVCCSGACSGGCDVCRTSLGASAEGTCTVLASASAGSGCGSYLCNGATGGCPTSCTSDASCTSGNWCRTSDSTCQAKQAAGSACSAANQCTSGFCVDGVCCSTACSGLCQACSAGKTGGTNGTCASVSAATDPDSECTSDAASTCQRDGTCDGAGACRLYVSGTSCNTTACSAGVATTYTCNGSGTCTPNNSACGTYACNGASGCYTSCTLDAQCSTGNWCSGGACVAKRATGSTCTSTVQCASNFCVDGVCCDVACTGSCQACTTVKKGGGANGTCGSVAGGTDPDAECSDSGAASCGNDGFCNGAGACRKYGAGTSCGTASCAAALLTTSACDGAGTCAPSSAACPTGYGCESATACAGACTADAQCAAGYFCRTSDGTCQGKLAQGALCTAASQCTSGNCVDGFCCDSACGGLCQACSAALKGSGADGACGSIKSGTDPASECAASAQSTCGFTGSCNGAGACARWPFGTACGATNCASAVQTGQICNGTGTCTSGGSAPCTTGYVCADATSCATSCTADAQCATATHFCRTSDGTCQPKLGQGAACAASTQCASAQCVDGVCCDSACSGACRACSAAKKGSGADGVCGNVKTDTDPDNECTAAQPSSCGLDGFCDGAGACGKYAAGIVCGSTTCTNGSQVGSSCDGFGVCATGQTTQCSPFTCANGSVCATTCTDDTACVASAFCNVATGACLADLAAGAACTRAGQCQSGFCVDGVCCSSACNTGACTACSAAKKGSGTDGTCGNIATATDPDAECVDDGAASCAKNGLCNGSGACATYALGTPCGATTCTSGTQTGYTCNGLGTCTAAGTSSCAPYVCQGTACGATCVVDADCVAGSYCKVSSGTCVPDEAVGQACTSASQCQGGNCVDGVCCNGPCAGTCQACSLAKTGQPDGQCDDVLAGSDPDSECANDGAATCKRDGFCSGTGACELFAQGTACGATTCASGQQTGYVCDGLGACQAGQTAACAPYVCNGASTCLTSCTSDADCVASSWCDVATGTCKADQPSGQACTGSSQCSSSFCVDGVCCDQACAGACKACSAARKGGGADGTCDVVSAGTDPDSDCSATPPGSCAADGECDGAGACRKWAAGTACGQNSCVGSTLTGRQCDGFGVCTAAQSTPCDPYVCLGGSACATSCGSDADCLTSAYCAAGTCTPKIAQGAACTAGNQCQSSFCVEGVCCNSACNGTCQACTAANQAPGGTDGTCAEALAGVDPHGDCEDLGAPTCGHDGACDGSGACRNYAVGTVCGDTACAGQTQTGFACSGPGVCQSGSTVDCAPFNCELGRCLTTCASDAQCSSTSYCDLTTSTCTPKSADGDACTGPDRCASGYCVDGVCCDTACSGQCEACDVGTALGKCSPVVGAPHGTRDACPVAPGTSPDELCQARTCDGAISTASCVAYVGPSTGCRDASCAGGVETHTATCNGAGQCGAAGDAKTEKCGFYACGAQQCNTSCTSEADCSAGNRCDTASHTCTSGSVCDGDHTIVNVDGSTVDCAPFRCDSSGTCISRCTTTGDCSAPAVCNTDRVCVKPAGASPSADSGCGCRTTPQAPSSSLVAGLIALGLALGRRRRTLSRRA